MVLPQVRQRGEVERAVQALRRLATLVTSKAYQGAQQTFLYSEDLFASTGGGNGKRISALQVADRVLVGVPIISLTRL
jgi:hypothetical protein